METNYNKTNKDYSLFAFAWCGTTEQFNEKLADLSRMAEPEKWSFNSENSQDLNILRKYIFKTFERCHYENKIVYSKDNSFCCVNTGLITPKGKDIIMLFAYNENPNARTRWYLKGYWTTQDRDFTETFDKIPPLAQYSKNVQDYFFNPEFDIEVNYDHIIDDNWDRIQSVIKMPQQTAELVLIGALEKAIHKAKRNMRLVTPQYYNDKIGFLLPIEIPPMSEGTKSEYLVLAIETTPFEKYRANTILNVEMAYEKARLLMKIEDNWLNQCKGA